MSIYSEMLRLTLQAGGDAPATSVADLVADALACRARLPAAADPAGGSHRGSAERVGDALAYDAALVRLCNRLGVEHDLMGGWPGLEARQRAEAGLAERLPTLSAALAGGQPGGPVLEP